MPRVSAEEVARLEREIALERLATARGITLTRKGKTLTGRCPFHKDAAEATLTLDSKTNTWTCSTCGTGGVVAWTMKAEGISKRHAVELLRADVVPAPRSARRQGRQRGPVVKTSTARKLDTPFDATTDDPSLLAQVVGYYHATLTETPDALAYLEARGLKSAEMIEHFKLGYANRTLAYRLPAKTRVAGASIRGRLEQLGILRASGHEHLNGSIVIPIFDEHGQAVGVYGRKITRGLRSGTPLHLYVGEPTALWNLNAVTASPTIILCGSFMDALTWWCAGHRNVSVFHDVDGFAGVLGMAFRAHGVKKAYLAFRRDEAGSTTVEKLGPELNTIGVETFPVQFPQGMDANEYAATSGEAANDSLGALLRKAVWMGKGTSPGLLPGPRVVPDVEDVPVRAEADHPVDPLIPRSTTTETS